MDFSLFKKTHVWHTTNTPPHTAIHCNTHNEYGLVKALFIFLWHTYFLPHNSPSHSPLLVIYSQKKKTQKVPLVRDEHVSSSISCDLRLQTTLHFSWYTSLAKKSKRFFGQWWACFILHFLWSQNPNDSLLLVICMIFFSLSVTCMLTSQKKTQKDSSVCDEHGSPSIFSDLHVLLPKKLKRTLHFPWFSCFYKRATNHRAHLWLGQGLFMKRYLQTYGIPCTCILCTCVCSLYVAYVLQCVAVCCSVLQCVAVCCSVFFIRGICHFP